MTDRNELFLRAQLRNASEALVHANEIADKVDADNDTGWYDPTTRPELKKLQADPEYLRNGMQLMQKVYGQKLATYICGLDQPALFGRYAKGVLEPDGWQKQPIRDAIEITEVLLVSIDPRLAKLWWTTPNFYIDPMGMSLPMDEIRQDPSLVRNAALSLIPL